MPKRNPLSQAAEREARQVLGGLIRTLRGNAGLTLTQVATASGFASYRPVWLIEKGKMAIPPEKVASLECALGLPPATLFWREVRCRLVGLGFVLPSDLQESPPATPEEIPELAALVGSARG
jgi:transcriptional regulator with XRE-family HTH domain